MEVHDLTSFTVCFLKLLVSLYNAGKIDYKLFYEIAKLKVKFLEDNITNIPSSEGKEQVMSILLNCKKICSCL